MNNARILIVEDESLVAADLEDRLTRLGYAIAAVTDNGADAIRAARESRVDLALMDIKIMGDLDGVQTASQLHDEFEFPVVYLTSHSDVLTLQRAGNTAPYGYIIKPYDECDLQATIEMAFHRRMEDQQMRSICQWFTNLLFNVTDPILAVNPGGQILFMNPAAEDLIGWDLADVKGRFSSELLQLANGRTGEVIANPLKEAFLNNQDVHSEENIILTRRNGSSLSIEYTATALYDERENVVGAVLVIRDVSRHKFSEHELHQLNRRLEKANQQLQAIVNASSHQTSNPLNDY